MHWLRFVACNALGAALWVGVWTSIGYLAGDHVEAISQWVTYVAAAAALAVIALVFVHVRRRRRRRASRSPSA